VSLKDLAIQDEYRSSECNIVKDFYIPCLEQATVYNRAVGYFSSSSMACVAQGLTAFVRSGGQMRLITSPHLSEEDVAAIELGLKNREQTIEAALLWELESELPQVIQDRLAALAWLLGNGLLEIKLAIPKTLRKRGIYHEKLGVFVDVEGHVVTFTGSANESASTLIDNFECLDVYCSWDEGVSQRALQKAKNFQDLWNDQTKNVEVMPFPEAVARSLLTFCPTQPPTQEPRVAALDEGYDPAVEQPPLPSSGIPTLPFWLSLRPYQQQAIANWFVNKGRGTLKMATGSGKTITALAIAATLYEKCQAQNKPFKVLLIVCPYRHLVTQWAEESRRQLEAVTELLKYRLGYSVEPYIAETTLGERDDLRYAFEKGHLKGLVAIRCLDEGVDIPAIRTAVILASSSNPRQFIQRRGRILRRSPGKNQAELFDMLVVPPDLGREYWQIERRVLRGELARFVEFADLALNAGEARKILYPLQERYDLLDL
jgi:hypothetical protein